MKKVLFILLMLIAGAAIAVSNGQVTDEIIEIELKDSSGTRDLEREGELLMRELQSQRGMYDTDLMFGARVGYQHTQPDRNEVTSELSLKWDAKKWWRLEGGLRVTTYNIYNVWVRGDFLYRFGSFWYIGLRNDYRYNLFVKDNIQKFDMRIGGEFEMDYLYAFVGVSGNFKTQIARGDETRYYKWQVRPIYDLKLWIMDRESKWNLGAEASGMMETGRTMRWIPDVILNAYYWVEPEYASRLKLEWQLGCRIDENPTRYHGAFIRMSVQFYI